MSPIPIYGEPAGLVGQRVEALRSQSFISNGELVSSANAIFIKIATIWYRVVLDFGTVHWLKQDDEPAPWEVLENGWSYPHRDIGAELGVAGTTLLALNTSKDGSSIRIEFGFSNGRRMVFFNRDDSTSYFAA
jgi:hypothetical protein